MKQIPLQKQRINPITQTVKPGQNRCRTLKLRRIRQSVLLRKRRRKMRVEEFKMERPNLVTVGQEVELVLKNK